MLRWPIGKRGQHQILNRAKLFVVWECTQGGSRGKVMADHHNPVLSFINDAQYWRERADEMRRLAEGLRDPEAKRKMLDLASHYDRLARGSEQQPGPMRD